MSKVIVLKNGNMRSEYPPAKNIEMVPGYRLDRSKINVKLDMEFFAMIQWHLLFNIEGLSRSRFLKHEEC